MTALPAIEDLTDADTTEEDFRDALDALYGVIFESPGSTPAPTLTVSGGAIVPTTGSFLVDGASPTNSLTNIVPAAIPTWDGRFIFLRNFDDSRTITISHLAGGSGQVKLTTAASFTLSNTTQWLCLRFNSSAGYWEEVFRNWLPRAPQVDKTATFEIAAIDRGMTFICTGTYTITVDAVADLGSDFFCYIQNNGTGVLTIDPSASDTINGAATLTLAAGDDLRLLCDGTILRTTQHITNRFLSTKLALDSQNRLEAKSAAYGDVVALTDAATVTPDLAAGNNFSWTIGGNRILANPTNIVAGQDFKIVIKQDATGGRSISFGTFYKFEGGAIPLLTATAAAVDVLVGYVDSTSTITCKLLKDRK